MIVPMKRTYILLQKKDESLALEALQKLGVIHLNIGSMKNHDSKDRSESAAKLANIEKVLNILGQTKVEPAKKTLDGELVYQQSSEFLSRRDELAARREILAKNARELSHWGNFNIQDLSTLEQKNIFVKLCMADEKVFNALAEQFNCELISRNKNSIYFAVIANSPEINQVKLPLASLPDSQKTYRELTEEISAIDRNLADIEKKLIENSAQMISLAEYRDNVKEELEFLTARDSIAPYGEISCIEGFVPAPELNKIQSAAKAHGWGYLAEDAPADDPEVPTLLNMPNWTRFIKPLFSFLGITPGYNEMDVSSPVTIFFTIFFGILIGDAGYGSVFLVIGGILWWKNRHTPVGSVFKLISLLSISAIIWGGLTGNCFGMSTPGIPALTDPATKDKNTQIVCFSLGILQLCLGHIWRMFIRSDWRNLLAQSGWILIFIGNFILIYCLLIYPQDMPKIMMYLYGTGILMVGIGEINWTDAGSIFGFPFSIVNSFVDLLSYIRLFAVGIAGYYLAFSFNGMATEMMKSGVGGIIGAVIVLLCGHLLNIALAVLSVLVHGVRLNTLEFSSHIGLQWAGFAFKPFSKNDNK